MSTLLGGCDQVTQNKVGRKVIFSAEDLTYRVQRFLLRSNDLAPEYTEADITQHFRPNGTNDPPDKGYKALARNNFVDWRLVVDGLVDNPLKLSLVDLRALPSRTQITRHDCVEGWSCIGKWKGVPLSEVLTRASVKPQAKYAVFYCADSMDGYVDDDTSDATDPPAEGDASVEPTAAQSDATSGDSDSVRYYESLDLVDAVHPQTILAYEMNDKPLPVPYGAPLRLRVERQLGYKMAKYLMRISLVDDFSTIGGGNGGYWEDQGYEWFAGI
ncbi:MAG TPA: molybdopterin-binding protein [Beijerinckiaceae bacterium]|nr:molybdopterin-binding protein [Beijerinckiaceae bacterium]